MAACRWSMLGMLTWAAFVANGAALAESPATTTEKATAVFIRALQSDDHLTRDQALVALAQQGQPALQALLEASISPDPELSWRAREALQIVCRTVDTAHADAVHHELLKLSNTTDPKLASTAKQALARWPANRNDFAVGELQLLGARVADLHLEGYETLTVDGAMEIDGGIMFGMEPLMEAAEVIEEEAVEEPKAAIPLIGGIMRAFGRVAGKIHEVDEARGDAIGEAILAKMAGELDRAEKLADVDVIEPPPVAMEEIDEELPALEVMDADFAVPFDGPDAFAAGEVFDPVAVMGAFGTGHGDAGNNNLPPGTMRLDASWRGADDGLRFTSQLQHIHSVALLDAAVTDAALTHLGKMKSLARLEIRGTQISGAALQKFQQERPHVDLLTLGPAVMGVSGHDHPRGMLIQNVIAESGARRAGLDAGDIITRLDGQRVRGFNQLTLALFDKKPGQNVKIDYIRAGKQLSCDVVLNARDPAPAESSPRGHGDLREQIMLQHLKQIERAVISE